MGKSLNENNVQGNDMDNRCLGIVRFWNEEKSFGFIDTNSYGIDDTANNDDKMSKAVELYFNFRDIAYAGHPHEHEWVTFTYKPSLDPDRRGFANHVRPLRYSESELKLVLKYQGPFAIISTPNERRAVLSLVKDFLLLAKNKQSVIDAIIEIFDQLKGESRQLILYTVANKPCLDILLDSSDVSINNEVVFQELQSEILLHLFNTSKAEANHLAAQNTVEAFSTCLSHVNDVIIEKLRNTIDLSDDTTIALLRQLPMESFYSIFMSDSDSEGVRVLQDKLVDIWNKEVITGAFSWNPRFRGCLLFWEKMLAHGYNQFLSALICRNSNSTDYLLLHAFLFLADVTCYNKIKDKSIFISWLPKLDENSLRAFVEVCKFLPEELLLRTLKSVGPRNIIGLYCMESIGSRRIIQSFNYGKIDVNAFPRQMVIRLYAHVIAYNSSESVEYETVECGGHFTWGEGWQESYTTYKDTCIYKDCSCVIYAEADNYDIVKNSLSVGRGEIEELVRSCIEKQKTSCLFVEAANGEDAFINLELHESRPESKYIKLYARIFGKIRIISKREEVR